MDRLLTLTNDDLRWYASSQARVGSGITALEGESAASAKETFGERSRNDDFRTVCLLHTTLLFICLSMNRVRRGRDAQPKSKCNAICLLMEMLMD
jgi:hypothetical protein